jgi:hydrogenase maturation protein HypF
MRSASSLLQRRRLTIQGIVQGVGFRPFVYSQVLHWGLSGFVLNDSLGVTIEVEGPLQALDSFLQALPRQAPPLARIDTLVTELIPLTHETGFVIVHSKAVRTSCIDLTRYQHL